MYLYEVQRDINTGEYFNMFKAKQTVLKRRITFE